MDCPGMYEIVKGDGIGRGWRGGGRWPGVNDGVVTEGTGVADEHLGFEGHGASRAGCWNFIAWLQSAG